MFSRWKEVRSKVTPGFTSGKLKLMYPLIQDVCNELLKHLREENGEGKERGPFAVFSTATVYGSSFSC
jgi:cytochrome P450